MKFLAKSTRQGVRGANTFNEYSGSSRPTLLVLDDIDTNDSTANSAIIDKNYNKIIGETIGAMSSERSKIIFL